MLYFLQKKVCQKEELKMDKIALIVNSDDQPNANLFLKEFIAIGGEIDLIICLTPNKNLLFSLKKIFKPLKIFKPNNLKQLYLRFLKFVFGGIQLTEVFASYNNVGENSWDLLPKGDSLKIFAKNNKVKYINSLSIETSLFPEDNRYLVATYGGGIIGKELLNGENLTFFNAHMGSMPRYRGMNVIEWAYLERQPLIATFLTMNDKIDDGDVGYELEIKKDEISSISLLRKIGYEFCAKAMAQGLFKLRNNQIKLVAQNRKGIRYYYRMHPNLRADLEKLLIK